LPGKSAKRVFQYNLTRQSIISETTLEKRDGYAGPVYTKASPGFHCRAAEALAKAGKPAYDGCANLATAEPVHAH
jgi:hypothetical protein